MNKTRALPWVIDILDDGLRIYRRFLSDFVLAAAIGIVPVGVLGLITNGLVLSQLGESWSIVSSLIISPITFLLLLYAISVLSRMTEQVLRDGQPQLRAALPMQPKRVLGMGCSTFLFLIAVGVAASVTGGICTCIGLLAVGGAASAAFTGSGLGFTGFGILTLGLGLFVYVVLASSMYTGAVYATQSFALERGGFGPSMSRSYDLLFFRFGRNLLCLLGAGAIIATLGFAIVGTAAAAGGLVLSLFDIDLSPTLTNVLISLLSTVPLIILVPPLPIWMALLHMRLRSERDGGDLPQRITAWAVPQQAA